MMMEPDDITSASWSVALKLSLTVMPKIFIDDSFIWAFTCLKLCKVKLMGVGVGGKGK